MRVINNEKILLVRCKDNPEKGKWTNPGDYNGQTELIDHKVSTGDFPWLSFSDKLIRIPFLMTPYFPKNKRSLAYAKTLVNVHDRYAFECFAHGFYRLFISPLKFNFSNICSE